MTEIRVNLQGRFADHRARRLDRVYVAYTDPGHGWLAVPTRTLYMLGIADKITSYSYLSHSGKTAYLEEDADANTFVEALKRHDVEFRNRVINCANRPSSIRRLPRYTC